MTRPTTHDDLPDYYRDGHLVAEIPSTYITRYPSLGQHLLAALAEADRLGLDVTEGGAIRIPLTDAELDKNLSQVQRSWDIYQEWYEQAVDGAVELEAWKLSSVRNHAKSEGLPLPGDDAEAVAR